MEKRYGRRQGEVADFWRGCGYVKILDSRIDDDVRLQGSSLDSSIAYDDVIFCQNTGQWQLTLQRDP